MDAINTILAPTDLSESSKPGVQYALEMAKSVQADVIIFHVAHYEDEFPYPVGMGEVTTAYTPTQSFDSFISEREKALNRFVSDNFSGLTTDLKVLLAVDSGSADEMIVGKAEKDKADLIVMATHGRTGLSHILIGSVTEHVIRRAPCPVLSVRGNTQANP